jgi:hypothetical protein
VKYLTGEIEKEIGGKRRYISGNSVPEPKTLENSMTRV